MMLQSIRKTLSRFLRTPLPGPETAGDGGLSFPFDRKLPYPSSWQSPANKELSVLAYNCAVATKVSLFSGWEKEEFEVSQIRRQGRDLYFEVSVNDGRIFGELDVEEESLLQQVWDIANAELPWSTSFDLKQGLSADSRPENGTSACVEPIATCGERYAIRVLLVFAGLSLKTLKQAPQSSSPLFNCLSILFPLVSMACFNVAVKLI